MILLGSLYKFSELELKELSSSFPEVIPVLYNSDNPSHIIEEIELIVNSDSQCVCLIVLNTLDKIPNDIVEYLERLDCRGVRFMTIRDFLEKYLYKNYIALSLSDLNYLSNIDTYTKQEYFFKRVFDYLVSIPLVIVTLPIMAYAAYRVKKESPEADVLFKQKRVGLNGKEFVCYKFRSMRTDIDYKCDYTQEEDPRVFPWGNFMRKTRIDELPQLLNVLKGDMHLIGPRAEWSKLVKCYKKEIPFYNMRSIVKPGITGWAQVKYKYGGDIKDTKEKLMYDIYYIKNWSILLELKTLWLTVKVVVGRKGL